MNEKQYAALEALADGEIEVVDQRDDFMLVDTARRLLEAYLRNSDPCEDLSTALIFIWRHMKYLEDET